MLTDLLILILLYVKFVATTDMTMLTVIMHIHLHNKKQEHPLMIQEMK